MELPSIRHGVSALRASRPPCIGSPKVGGWMSSTLHRGFLQIRMLPMSPSKCHTDFDGILEQHVDPLDPMQAYRHWERTPKRLLNILTPGTLCAKMELLRVASVEADTDSARNGFSFEDEKCHSFWLQVPCSDDLSLKYCTLKTSPFVEGF